MFQKCSQRHALLPDEFDLLHEECMLNVITTFSADPASDLFSIQLLKRYLQFKYFELKKENDAKPTKESIASGAIVGSLTGVGMAAGGAAGTTAVTSALAVGSIVSTGGLVLVGVAAVGVGIGVGIGVQKLVSHVQRKKSLGAKATTDSDVTKTK